MIEKHDLIKRELERLERESKEIQARYDRDRPPLVREIERRCQAKHLIREKYDEKTKKGFFDHMDVVKELNSLELETFNRLEGDREKLVQNEKAMVIFKKIIFNSRRYIRQLEKTQADIDLNKIMDKYQETDSSIKIDISEFSQNLSKQLMDTANQIDQHRMIEETDRDIEDAKDALTQSVDGSILDEIFFKGATRFEEREHSQFLSEYA